MNKTLIFFCISTVILALSIIVTCISPVINNITIKAPDGGNWSWSISSWRTLNCKLYEDKQNDEDVNLDDIQKYKKLKNLCKAKKAMHDLEFASLVINLVLGFVCANFSLLHFLEVGKDFEKKTGIIGFITGIIGFIITLVFVCFNGYIFNNDIAYGYISNNEYVGRIEKLYSNGAITKVDGTHVYDNDKSDFYKYAKYKDLGGKQYNYDSKYYKAHQISYQPLTPGIPSTPIYKCISGYSIDPADHCEYLFPETAYYSFDNKDLYDRWVTTLILSVFIIACHIGLLIFGFLLFKGGAESNEPKTVEIQ